MSACSLTPTDTDNTNSINETVKPDGTSSHTYFEWTANSYRDKVTGKIVVQMYSYYSPHIHALCYSTNTPTTAFYVNDIVGAPNRKALLTARVDENEPLKLSGKMTGYKGIRVDNSPNFSKLIKEMKSGKKIAYRVTSQNIDSNFLELKGFDQAYEKFTELCNNLKN